MCSMEPYSLKERSRSVWAPIHEVEIHPCSGNPSMKWKSIHEVEICGQKRALRASYKKKSALGQYGTLSMNL